MNDRFKFRGQGRNGEWFYGSLLWYADEPQIWDKDGYNFIVKAETITQCTGLKDKNDKLIFEGDIVEVQYLGAQISLFKNEYSKHPENERFEVFCDEDWLKFYAKNDHYRKTCEIHSFDLEKIRTNTYDKVYEVIGNIYENPELLEVK